MQRVQNGSSDAATQQLFINLGFYCMPYSAAHSWVAGFPLTLNENWVELSSIFWVQNVFSLV